MGGTAVATPAVPRAPSVPGVTLTHIGNGIFAGNDGRAYDANGNIVSSVNPSDQGKGYFRSIGQIQAGNYYGGPNYSGPVTPAQASSQPLTSSLPPLPKGIAGATPLPNASPSPPQAQPLPNASPRGPAAATPLSTPPGAQTATPPPPAYRGASTPAPAQPTTTPQGGDQTVTIMLPTGPQVVRAQDAATALQNLSSGYFQSVGDANAQQMYHTAAAAVRAAFPNAGPGGGYTQQQLGLGNPGAGPQDFGASSWQDLVSKMTSGAMPASQVMAAEQAVRNAIASGDTQAAQTAGPGAVGGKATGDWSTAGVLPSGLQPGGTGYVAPGSQVVTTADAASNPQDFASQLLQAAQKAASVQGLASPLAQGLYSALADITGGTANPQNASATNTDLTALVDKINTLLAPPQQSQADLLAQAQGQVNPGIDTAEQKLTAKQATDQQNLQQSLAWRRLYTSPAGQNALAQLTGTYNTNMASLEGTRATKTADALAKLMSAQTNTNLSAAKSAITDLINVVKMEQSDQANQAKASATQQQNALKAMEWLMTYNQNQQKIGISQQRADTTQQNASLNRDKYLTGATGTVYNPTTGQPVTDAQGNPVQSLAAIKQGITLALNRYKAMGYTDQQTADALGIPIGTLTEAAQAAANSQAGADARSQASLVAAWDRMVATQAGATTRANQSQAGTDWRTQYDQAGTNIRALQQRIQTVTDAVGSGTPSADQASLLKSLQSQLSQAQAAQVALGPPPAPAQYTAPTPPPGYASVGGAAPPTALATTSAPPTGPSVPAYAANFSPFAQQVAAETAAEHQAGNLKGPLLQKAINDGIKAGKLTFREGSAILNQYGLT